MSRTIPTLPAPAVRGRTRFHDGYAGLSICYCFSSIPKFSAVRPLLAPMNSPAPHYLLHSTLVGDCEAARWRFVLRTDDGSVRLEAEDIEPDIQGERLELLAVIRGLQAIDQPSRVTLMTPSKLVREGVRYGLADWRRNGWRWEFFGQMVPVKNCDLWQRIDSAMRFHQVECLTWRFDPPHTQALATEFRCQEGPHAVDKMGIAADCGGQEQPWVRIVVEMCRRVVLWGQRRFRRLVRGPLAPSL